MAKKGKVTPLMKQYQAIKKKHPEALLLFRVGDFYETFGQDAVRTAEVLDIVLTHRNNGGDQTELAGFPHHALNTYLPKLVRAGERVAICDQLEDPKQTKTIVKRGVTELVTPGVALHDDILEKKSNNYLASLFFGRQKTGLALLDISTGEFLTTEGSLGIINKLLQQFAPSEILMPRADRKKIEQGEVQSSAHPFYLDGWVYSEDYALETLTRHFKTKSLQGFGIQNTHNGVLAAGAILHYLSETQHKQLSHINRLQPLGDDRHLWMDRFTLLNLELFSTARGEGTPLLKIIDHTHTPMGGRILKRWLAFPLTDRGPIEKRLEAVEQLFEAQQNLSESPLSFGELEDALKQIGDLERYMAKVATAKIQPREFLRLAESLAAVQRVHKALSPIEKGLLKELQPALKGCPALEERLSSAIDQEAPAIAQKGGIFRNRLFRRTRCPAGKRRQQQKLFGCLTEKRSRTYGNHFLKNRLQQCLRVLYRSAQHPQRQGSGRVDPQTDLGQCRALHHRGTQGIRGRNFGGGRKKSPSWKNSSTPNSSPSLNSIFRKYRAVLKPSPRSMCSAVMPAWLICANTKNQCFWILVNSVSRRVGTRLLKPNYPLAKTTSPMMSCWIRVNNSSWSLPDPI